MLDALLSHDLIALFVVVALGLALGRITVAGVSLGSSGVLFTALGLGYLGYARGADYALPGGAGTLGLVLFVYGVGLTAGPSFFRAFAKQGKTLAVLGLTLVGSGAVAVTALGAAFQIPGDLAAGLFAGALTSTPALAAGTEAVTGLTRAMDASLDPTRVSIGYGIAYPFGVVGVVLFVQLLPRLLRCDLAQEAVRSQKRSGVTPDKIVRRMVEVTQSQWTGKRPAEVPGFEGRVQVPRRLEDGRLVPIGLDFTFQAGAVVTLVGRESDVAQATAILGHESDAEATLDADRERMRVVVSGREVIGKTLRDLDTLGNFGVVITRLTRVGVDFVPGPETVLLAGDQLTVVGGEVGLGRFAESAGHRAKLMDESDLVSLALGITAGVAVGITPVMLPGGRSVALGLAGGPLLVALILGHFGRLGPIVGYLPRAARLVLMELGLVLFLASAGVKAGAAIVPVVQEYGVTLLGVGALVTLIPMTLGYIVARYILKLPILDTLGGTCGGMTSTPGLGAITAKTDADAPVVAYAAAYPVALILMTVLAKTVVGVLG